mmetsp:Transcript_20283/g.32466  ORF Transcript_20283/g.32466 Transcript_20283/m.32466 type:complete len:163 (+) Transcript_20283:1-489(+)
MQDADGDAAAAGATVSVPQAAMFARTYLPQRVADTVRVWKEQLKRISPAAANALGSPQTHPDAFPDADDDDGVDEEEEEQDIAPPEPIVQAQAQAEEEEEIEQKNVDVSDDVSLPSGVDDDEEEEEDIIDNGEDQGNAVAAKQLNDEDEDDDDFNIDDLEDI